MGGGESRGGTKICFPKGSAGSSPAVRTTSKPATTTGANLTRNAGNVPRDLRPTVRRRGITPPLSWTPCLDMPPEAVVIKWAAIFAVLALVMAVLGFGGLAGAFIDIAKVLFWLAVIVAVVLFILGYTVYKKVT